MQQPRPGCIIMNQSVHYSLFQNQLVRYCQLLVPGAVFIVYPLAPVGNVSPEHGKSAFRLWANTTGPHMVRTTRNLAFPLIMRAYPSAAFASGYFSIIGRTPVISANRRVSCESVGMPPAQPLIPFLPKSN